MKVLFLTNVPAPYRVDFFSELGEKVDLTVVYERDSASNRNEKWKSKAKGNFKEIYLKSKKIGSENSLSFEIIRYLKNYKYDHIIIGQYSTFTAMIAILYMKLHKIRFIINSDGGFINYQEQKFKYKLKKFFISSADYWLSTGKHTDEYFIYYGAKKNRIFKYPFTSIRKEDLLKKVSPQSKNKYKQILNIDCNNKMIIAIGSFIKRKGMDILIKASKELDNNIKVYIIGGEITAEYENMLNNLHIDNVTFVNFMEKEKLLNYYRAADLFVLPTREDIWGLVINEALANGLPVITSKYCGAGLELIKNDYNGYIIDNNESPIEYANRINEYCSNDELLKSMSKNSLCSIENYTIENMANQTFEILKKLHY